MIFVVVGPSGAGKDTLIAAALQHRPDVRWVQRVITRPTATDGEPFEGVSEQEFMNRKAQGAFALDWQAHGLSYGIPKSQLAGPGDAVFNGSRAALTMATSLFSDLRVILVTAPNAILAQRLAHRGRETAADIRARLDRASFQLPDGIMATTVVNDGTVARGVDRLLVALQPVRA